MELWFHSKVTFYALVLYSPTKDTQVPAKENLIPDVRDGILSVLLGFHAFKIYPKYFMNVYFESTGGWT